MAIADALERLKSGFTVSEGEKETPAVEVPDDLSSLDDVLEPDPTPRRREKSAKARPPVTRVTAPQKRAIRDQLVFMLTMPAAGLAMRDEHCGGALLAQAEPIADALVPIICRNASMLAWFLGDAAPWMDWLALAMALQPVGASFWAHHIAKTVDEEENEDGSQADQFRAPAFA